MLAIRLARHGSKKAPFYRVVLTDSRNKRDGSFKELLGFYNPMNQKVDVDARIDLAKVDYWVARGAQMSDRISSIVKHLRKNSTNEASAQDA